MKDILSMIEVREFIDQEEYQEVDAGGKEFLRKEQKVNPESDEREQEKYIPRDGRETEADHQPGE
jgi:hypothetical protein